MSTCIYLNEKQNGKLLIFLFEYQTSIWKDIPGGYRVPQLSWCSSTKQAFFTLQLKHFHELSWLRGVIRSPMLTTMCSFWVITELWPTLKGNLYCQQRKRRYATNWNCLRSKLFKWMKMGDCPKKSIFKGEINRLVDIYIGLHKVPFQMAYILSIICSTGTNLSSG